MELFNLKLKSYTHTCDGLCCNILNPAVFVPDYVSFYYFRCNWTGRRKTTIL